MERVGIIRRIDELGRIVIPKEIRIKLFNKKEVEGEQMEFFLDGDTILLKRAVKDKEKSEEEIRNDVIDEFVNMSWEVLGSDDSDILAKESIREIAEIMKKNMKK